jgi:pentatricopeptide repeat protein
VQGDLAMDLMTQIRAAGLRPDVVSYSSLIAALSRGGDWMRVVGVLGSIEEAPDVEANEFVFSAAIAAMERAGEWENPTPTPTTTPNPDPNPTPTPNPNPNPSH